MRLAYLLLPCWPSAHTEGQLSSEPNRENHKAVYFLPEDGYRLLSSADPAEACRASVRTATNAADQSFNRSGANVGSPQRSPADSRSKTPQHAVGIYAGK